jgi:copper oxidase (laccase) domain-containing protein
MGMVLESHAELDTADVSYEAVELNDLPANVGHAFFQRHGGYSTGGYASLNVGTATTRGGESQETIRRNVQRALEAIGKRYEDLAMLQSRYNGSVSHITDIYCDPIEGPSIADGLVCSEAGVVLGAVSADAHIVAFMDKHGRAVGLAVAAWRSVMLGVLDNVLIGFEGHRIGASDLVAVIGPGLGPQSYEMGEDVYRMYASMGWAGFFMPHPEKAGKWLLDMPALIRTKLEESGVTVYDMGIDTLTNPDFFSARRFVQEETRDLADGIHPHYFCGRQLNCVWMEAESSEIPDGAEI